MKARCFALLMSFYCLNPYAAEMQLGFSANGNLTWQGINYQGDWVPYHWDVAMHHPSAESIILGGASIDNTSVTLSSDSDSVVIDGIALAGMQYQLAQGCTTTRTESGFPAGLSGNVLTVKGDGIGDMEVKCPDAQTAFTHFRPIVKVLESAENKFAGKPTGRYRGNTKATMQYNYYRDGIKIKHHVSFAFGLVIDYNASHISKISVTGNDDMVTRYYGYPTRLVDGKTAYQVKIEGTFQNGVFAGLKRSKAEDGRFYLEELAPQNGKIPQKIPFAVFCPQCKQNEFINLKGEPQIIFANKTRVPENEPFDLTVEFVGAKLDELEHGDYRGSFTLFFETGL